MLNIGHPAVAFICCRHCMCARCAGNLEQKQAEAARLKHERVEMMKRLKLYESKILQSENEDGKSLVEKAHEREEQLKKKQEELECRCGQPQSAMW
jgi:hypothetical protein